MHAEGGWLKPYIVNVTDSLSEKRLDLEIIISIHCTRFVLFTHLSLGISQILKATLIHNCQQPERFSMTRHLHQVVTYQRPIQVKPK